MKKTFFLTIASALLSFSAFASNGSDKEPLDTLAYIFPEFVEGSVIFKDKTLSHGILNICIIDQGVKTISEEGDIVEAASIDIVSCVMANNRKFYNDRGTFVELVQTDGDFGFGIAKSTIVVNNVKKGAFGTDDRNSNIKSYTREPYMKQYILDDPDNYVHKVIPYIFKGISPYIINKKNLQKLFPQQKAFIEEYLANPDVNIADIDQARKLYEILIEK